MKRTMDGESGREIALAMGLCENTVYTLRKRALDIMREGLER